ncbi:MAG: ATP-binding protein [Spirochaetia bacterium]|nr:ATP-binding protein [Spirochaetia bacterium]
MILKRKIYAKLKEWKQKDKGSCALLIDGARRVGKSFIAEEFAKNEYKSYILIDFANVPRQIKEFFELESYDLNLFFSKLSAFYGKRLYKRNSLIIFDEVQRFARAREMIKYLVADGRYDYLETGSLITLRKNIENIVIPSEEEHIKMYPLDFEEFLWAMGDEATPGLIRESYTKLRPLGQTLHRKVMNDFRQYMLVGGMPQTVLSYIENHDFEKADRIKKRILNLYRADVTKFAEGNEEKILSVFDDIPGQLSKKEKKYVLSDLNTDARMRNYYSAFLWLQEAMIVNTCFNATEPTAGLNLSSDHTTQKCYMADTGLLITHAFMDSSYSDNNLYQAILLDKLNINEGMLMENIVAQELQSHGHKLFFYSRSDTTKRQNHMEIDFLIRKGTDICPVEVKSGMYQRHASLDKFRLKFAPVLGSSFILYTKDVMIKDGIIHLPIYMAGCL